VTRYGSRQRQAAADAVARVERLVTKANYRRVTRLVIPG
jgi:hypothetical protein